jgi:hypothetical protein
MMEFIPEETTGKSTDTSPHQKFEKTENCILECVQNTVDAHIDKGTPILKFHFQLIKKSECDFLNNKNFEKHFKERKYNRRDTFDESIPCLIMEDFNTTGITGDPESIDDITSKGTKNNWFYFFHDFGGKSKLADSDKGGSEGEGMQTYMLNSGISTFFGMSSDYYSKKNSIFGMSYFGSRKVDEVRYNVFASFGKKKNIDNNDWAIPVTDDDKAKKFIDLFKLKRKLGESGVSIVVPFYKKEEINQKFIISIILDKYRIPIFRNQLKIFVADQEINAANIAELIHKSTDTVENKLITNDYFNFLKECDSVDKKLEVYEINFYNQKNLEKKDISNFEQFLKDFNDRKTIKLRVKFDIFKYKKDTKLNPDKINTFFDLKLKKYSSEYEDLRAEFNDFMRGAMPIYGHRSAKNSMFYLLDIQDDQARVLFKHAEKANHSEVSSENWKLKEDYKGYKNIISLSTKLPSKLYNLILSEDVDDDYEATQDLFKIDGEELGREDEIDQDILITATSNKKQNKEQNELSDDIKNTTLIVPPIFPSLKKYEVSQSNTESGEVEYNISGINYERDYVELKIKEAEKFVENVKKLDFSKFDEALDQKKIELTLKDAVIFEKRITEYQNFLNQGCTFYPRKIVIEAAFDCESQRSSFRSYSPNDFDFGDDQFVINLDGQVKLKEKNLNKIEIIAHKANFKFSVKGFKQGIEDIRWRDRNYTL